MTRSRAIATCMLGCAAVTWARFAAAGTLAVDAPQSWPARAWPLALTGALLGIAAWIYLGAVEAGDSPSLGGAIAIQLAAAAALPLTYNDLFSNLAYGRLSALGLNPYLHAPSALADADPFKQMVGGRWLGTPLAYGPILAGLNALAWRAGSLLAALVSFKLALAACAVAAVALAWRFARGRADGGARFALFAACPLFAWEIAAQAHNDGVMVLALVGFVVAAHERREALALACLAAALYAKLAAAPVLALYLVFLARRRPLAAAAGALAVLAAGVLLMLPFWQGAATLRGPFTTVGADAVRTSRSVADAVYWALYPVGPGAQAIGYRACWAAALALGAALGLRALWKVRTLADVVHQSLILLLAYDLTTPWFQPWYATWLLPFAMAEEDLLLQRTAALYAALVPLQYAVALDPVTSVAVDAVVAARLLRLARRRA